MPEPECEFKAECEKAYEIECVKKCHHLRKFAILVVNSFGEKVKEEIRLNKIVLNPDSSDLAWNDALALATKTIDQALKMEVE